MLSLVVYPLPLAPSLSLDAWISPPVPDPTTRRACFAIFSRARACMLQRYLNVSTRLAALHVAVNAAVLADNSDNANSNSVAGTSTSGEATVNASDCPPAKGGIASAGGWANPTESKGTSTNATSNSGTNKKASPLIPRGTILMAQLGIAEGILSRQLMGLSEGDLLLISERCAQHWTLAVPTNALGAICLR